MTPLQLKQQQDKEWADYWWDCMWTVEPDPPAWYQRMVEERTAEIREQKKKASIDCRSLRDLRPDLYPRVKVFSMPAQFDIEQSRQSEFCE
jgi:hypothetical protein